ncbi:MULTISPECIES: hypothetical protein [Streptomyces]|uniref:hypothetical protein n=1 Tax=Streptomyces TaxID=1883 RepID=UPI002F3F9E88
MEKATGRRLVHQAWKEGRVPEAALSSTEGEFQAVSGQVERESLWRTYRRRLRRTPPGSPLHDQTRTLVGFLEAFQETRLTMISVTPEVGGFDIFLADSQARQILFWMQMFSQRQETRRK